MPSTSRQPVLPAEYWAERRFHVTSLHGVIRSVYSRMRKRSSRDRASSREPEPLSRDAIKAVWLSVAAEIPLALRTASSAISWIRVLCCLQRRTWQSLRGASEARGATTNWAISGWWGWTSQTKASSMLAKLTSRADKNAAVDCHSARAACVASESCRGPS